MHPEALYKFVIYNKFIVALVCVLINFPVLKSIIITLYSWVYDGDIYIANILLPKLAYKISDVINNGSTIINSSKFVDLLNILMTLSKIITK